MKLKPGKGWLILFLIWPFLSFLRAIRQYWQPWARNVVWLFTIFFGYSIVSKGNYTDIQGYIAQFKVIVASDQSFSSFWASIYTTKSNYVDIIQPLITFIIASITSDYRILTAAFGAIYGYFYSRNVWYLIDFSREKLSWITGYILIVFALIIGMWEMNIFRFAVASQIFLYGTLPYFIEGKKKYLFVSALSIFFHFAYVLPVGVFLIYVITGNRIMIFYGLYLISFFISDIDFEIVRQYLWFLPDVFQERALSYINEDFAARRSMGFIQSSWHLRFAAVSIKYSVLILSTFFILRKKFIKEDKNLLSLFSFAFLNASIFNVLGVIPGIDRFPRMGYLFFFAAFFVFTQRYPAVKSFKMLIISLSPLLLFYCLFNIRMWLGFIAPTTLISNPLIAWIFENDVSIIELIKSAL